MMSERIKIDTTKFEIFSKRMELYRQILSRGRRGHVYFLKNNEFIKIGCSQHILQRINQLQAEHPGAKLIHAISCDDAFVAEKYFHQKFQDKHYKKEWFKLNEEDIQEVKKLRHHICWRTFMIKEEKFIINFLDEILLTGFNLIDEDIMTIKEVENYE